VVSLNKWDLAQPDVDEIIGVLHRKVRQQPSVVPVSAVTGEGLARLLSMVADLEARYTAHIPTAELNRALAAANEMRSLPSKGRRRLKTYFIAQFQTAPPRFAVRVNDRSLVTRDYGFFVENQLRQRLNLPGVPVIIDFREA
jgi:GTP-binding protein